MVKFSLDLFQFTFVSGVPCTWLVLTQNPGTALFQFTFVSGVPCT